MLRKRRWLGTRQQLDRLSTTELSLLSERIHVSTTVSNLGVLIRSAEHGQSRRFALPVVLVFSYVNFAWFGRHLRHKPPKHSCTHLLVAASTTATVYCTASVTSAEESSGGPEFGGMYGDRPSAILNFENFHLWSCGFFYIC